MIQIRCPGCQRRLKVDEGHLGKKGRCKQCGAAFVIARQEAPEAAPASLRPAVSMAVADPSIPRPDVTQAAPEAEARSPVGGVAGAEALVPLEWNVGDVILDLYEVKQVHTGGGMGLVYRVHHRNWNMDLAVKSPRADFFQTEQQKQTFIRECETWINLEPHPHIVSCYYVRALGEIPTVFAEYVEGGSLKDSIESRSLYQGGHQEALRRILDIAIQSAWGLHYAHEKGLVHRDVKPANFMMTTDGLIKVTDFGLAQARAATTEPAFGISGRSPHVSVGSMTPAYCSPEQASGHPLFRKTDIWSWGLCVLEMFTGERTWMMGQAGAEALKAYLEAGPSDPTIPGMPTVLADLLRECLQPGPEDRPRDMRQIARTLAQIHRDLIGTAYARQEPQAIKMSADWLNNRGVSMLEMGKEAAAGRLFDDALKSQPGHPEAAYNLKLLHWRQARLTDEVLLDCLSEIRKRHAKDWRWAYYLGLVHMERCDTEAASFSLNEAMESTDDKTAQGSIRQALDRLRDVPILRCERSFQAHTGDRTGVTSVFLSSDGTFALSGDMYGQVHCWDLRSGQCVRTLATHRDYGTPFAFLTPDARIVLATDGDSRFSAWEVRSGNRLASFQANSPCVVAAAISPDGRWIASGGGTRADAPAQQGDLCIWDMHTHTITRTCVGHSRIVTSVVFSPDCRHVLSGSFDGDIRLWDAATGECLRTLRGHTRDIEKISLSADGRTLLSSGGSGKDMELRIWDVATGHCARTFETGTLGSGHVCLSPNGRLAMTACKGKVQLWDTGTGGCIRTIRVPGVGLFGVCTFSADGGYVLVGGGDGQLHWWFTRPLMMFKSMPRTAVAAYSPATSTADLADTRREFERLLGAAGEAYANADCGEAVTLLRQASSLHSYVRDPELLTMWARLGLHCARRSLRDAWEVRNWRNDTLSVDSVGLSADGQLALVGGSSYRSSAAKLYSTKTAQLVRELRKPYCDRFLSVALSADAKRAVVASNLLKTLEIMIQQGRDAVAPDNWDNPFDLWDVEKGTPIRTFAGHHGSYDAIGCVCLSQDRNLVLSTGADKTICVWHAGTGRLLRRIDRQGYSQYLCLSGDTRFVVSATASNEEVAFWELSSGRCLRTFESHGSFVRAVAISADGHWMLLGCQDKTLRLVDLCKNEYIGACEGHLEYVSSVAISPDGRWGLSGSNDKTLRVWDLHSGKCLKVLGGAMGGVTSVAWNSNGRFAVCGTQEGVVHFWEMDWDYEFPGWSDWDDGARPHLANFLTLHTPFAAQVPPDGSLSEDQVRLALTRQGTPTWTEDDFKQLLHTLGCAGFGWLRPEGVKRELEKMAANWQGPPPLPWEK